MAVFRCATLSRASSRGSTAGSGRAHRGTTSGTREPSGRRSSGSPRRRSSPTRPPSAGDEALAREVRDAVHRPFEPAHDLLDGEAVVPAEEPRQASSTSRGRRPLGRLGEDQGAARPAPRSGPLAGRHRRARHRVHGDRPSARRGRKPPRRGTPTTTSCSRSPTSVRAGTAQPTRRCSTASLAARLLGQALGRRRLGDRVQPFSGARRRGEVHWRTRARSGSGRLLRGAREPARHGHRNRHRPELRFDARG